MRCKTSNGAKAMPNDEDAGLPWKPGKNLLRSIFLRFVAAADRKEGIGVSFLRAPSVDESDTAQTVSSPARMHFPYWCSFVAGKATYLWSVHLSSPLLRVDVCAISPVLWSDNMKLFSFLRWIGNHRSNRARASKRASAHLALEGLEDRFLPSTNAITG